MARRSAATSSTQTLTADTRIAVIYGDEEMLKREHLETLRAALEAAHGQVETFVIDGEFAPLADVLDELRSFGLMQQHKIVIVDNADVFVKNNREALERYAQAPVDSATLVFRGEAWNPGKLDTMIKKVGAILKCEAPPRDQAIRWTTQRCQSLYERKISAQAAGVLVDRLTRNLMRIDSELAKLALMVKPNETIESALIDQVVSRSSDEQAWAIQAALLDSLSQSAPGKAIEKLHELIDIAEAPDVMVMYSVEDLMRKLYLAGRMKKQGAMEKEIAGALRLWGPQQTAVFALLRKLDENKAHRLFDRILELDRRSRTSLGEPMRNLECFCAELVDSIR